jgi:hypothetical protein
MSDRVVGVKILTDASQTAATLKTTQQDVKGLGAAAQTGMAAASGAMAGYEKAARGAAASVGPLLVRQQQLASESARLAQGIDLLDRAMRRAPESAHIFNERMQELLLQKRAVGEESSKLKERLGSVGESLGGAAEKSSKAESGLGRLTSQVRTSGTIFEGFDGILTAGLASIGGVSIATSIFISLLGALIPKLFGASEAKKEEVELNIGVTQLVRE